MSCRPSSVCNGKLLVNTTDIIQRWTTYCSELYMAQLDQKVSNDLVKELKDISPLLAPTRYRDRSHWGVHCVSE